MVHLPFTAYDQEFYDANLKDFLPDTFIDCHNHIWLDEFMFAVDTSNRACAWPGMVAKDNSIEDLIKTNQDLYPGKTCIPVLYPQTSCTIDTDAENEYVKTSARKYNLPALYGSRPEQSAEEVERKVEEGGFCGLKVYQHYAPMYLPNDEIRIYDFLPHEHLALADRKGWVVQLHIPRPKRLADPVNYIQMLEIEEKYPNLQLIIAHLGRAYADEDIGNSLEYLKHTQKTIWDFTANTNEYVMEQVLNYFGPERFIYGSDFPIFRMRARRVVENGFYINEIPMGSLGDVSADPHMREIPYPEADKITYFIFEEIAACKKAADKLGLTRKNIDDIFYNTSARIFKYQPQ